ncbi:hypothetical protein STEG23_025134, partial [Scotinomys teguina]
MSKFCLKNFRMSNIYYAPQSKHKRREACTGIWSLLKVPCVLKEGFNEDIPFEIKCSKCALCAHCLVAYMYHRIDVWLADNFVELILSFHLHGFQELTQIDRATTLCKTPPFGLNSDNSCKDSNLDSRDSVYHFPRICQ